MKIAIDASRAFLKERTGIEEYAFQIIKNLRKDLKDHQVILYLRIGGKERLEKSLKIPEKWEIKEISFKYFWTQIGMAWEFLTNSPDVLFVPAHTIPWIHPKNSVVTVHGLEYEHCPKSYSLYSRWFHRFFINKSCKWAKKVIAISENTKNDLVKMYKVPNKKIKIVYNGFTNISKNTEGKKRSKNYLLYLGRIEQRKNIEGIVKAFEILKIGYGYQGQLVLAGKPGVGFEEIKVKTNEIKFSKDVVLKGYISDKERLTLMKNTDLFLFPSFCEGFGLPILEAQSVGAPVITSKKGPMDEVAGDARVLVDPHNIQEMVDVADRILKDKELRNDIIRKGKENVKKFSWEKCGKETARVLLGSENN